MRLTLIFIILSILWVSAAFAQQPVLVVDISAGTDARGVLFSVDSITGNRDVISDFGDGGQGPLGLTPIGVILDSSGDALVIDSDAGTGARGALFSVNLFTGIQDYYKRLR